MSEQLLAAVYQLKQAVEDEGRVPEAHRWMKRKHREEWPILWRAIDGVITAADIQTVVSHEHKHNVFEQDPSMRITADDSENHDLFRKNQ